MVDMYITTQRTCQVVKDYPIIYRDTKPVWFAYETALRSYKQIWPLNLNDLLK